MPTLRPLIDVPRYDAAFFAGALVPAAAAAGYEGILALAPDAGDVVVVASDTELDALLAGKQKTELSALDKLKRQKTTGGEDVSVRGTTAALRALVRALTPGAGPQRKAAREIGAESSSLPRGKRPDRVRRQGGGYIKGFLPGHKSAPAAPAPGVVVDAGRAAPSDRVQFALGNLRGFIEAGLARAGALEDDDGAGDGEGAVLVIVPGEVRRE